MQDIPAKRYLPSKKVRVRYGDISEMTVKRWVESPTLGFPQPLVINGIQYFDEAELDAFDQRQRKRKQKHHGEPPKRNHPKPSAAEEIAAE
jgi:hypothetical protein